MSFVYDVLPERYSHISEVFPKCSSLFYDVFSDISDVFPEPFSPFNRCIYRYIWCITRTFVFFYLMYSRTCLVVLMHCQNLFFLSSDVVLDVSIILMYCQNLSYFSSDVFSDVYFCFHTLPEFILSFWCMVSIRYVFIYFWPFWLKVKGNTKKEVFELGFKI